MVNKIPIDQISLAEAKRICANNGIKWLDMHSAYFKATGRTMYTTYTRTRIDRAKFANAITAWHVQASKYPGMSSMTAEMLTKVANQTYYAMLNADATAARRFKEAVGITGDPTTDPHPVQVAERYMDWMCAAR